MKSAIHFWFGAGAWKGAIEEVGLTGALVYNMIDYNEAAMVRCSPSVRSRMRDAPFAKDELSSAIFGNFQPLPTSHPLGRNRRQHTYAPSRNAAVHDQNTLS